MVINFMKKVKYYKFTCSHAPECGWEITGSWSTAMSGEFMNHFIDKHLQEPIITEVKNDKRTTKKHK